MIVSKVHARLQYLFKNQEHCFTIDVGNLKMPPKNKRITHKASMDFLTQNFVSNHKFCFFIIIILRCLVL